MQDSNTEVGKFRQRYSGQAEPLESGQVDSGGC